jgi:hypothetical protein
MLIKIIIWSIYIAYTAFLTFNDSMAVLFTDLTACVFLPNYTISIKD